MEGNVLLSAARLTTGSVAILERHLRPCAVIPLATPPGFRRQRASSLQSSSLFRTDLSDHVANGLGHRVRPLSVLFNNEMAARGQRGQARL
jgi:hypothetical protein